MIFSTPRTNRRFWLTIAAGGMLAAGASLMGQPAADSGQPADRDGAKRNQPERVNRPRAMSNDPAEFRKYLQRRMEASRRAQQKLEEAMAQLDKGVDPAEVRRSLEQATREHMAALGIEPGPRIEREDPREPGQGPGGPPPDGAGGDRPRPNQPNSGPLSPEEREQLRSLLREHRPALLTQLESLAPRDPGARERLVSGLGARFRDLPSLQKKDKEQFNFRLDELQNSADVMQATRAIMEAKRDAANPAALEKARAELRRGLTAQFDLRIRSTQHQIDQFKQRADRLQKELSTQQDRREKIIDEQMEKVISGSEKRRRPEGGDKPSAPPGDRP